MAPAAPGKRFKKYCPGSLGEPFMSSRPRHRKTGGRRAKLEARQHIDLGTAAFVERKIPYFEVLDEEGLQTIENNAETVLEEVGIVSDVLVPDTHRYRLVHNIGAGARLEDILFAYEILGVHHVSKDNVD